LARCSIGRVAAVELHFGEDPGQADRGQSQCDDQAGGPGAAAAGRRAADQPESASLPAAAAATTAAAAAEMRPWLLLGTLALSVPTRAQTRAVTAARASGVIGERYDGYIGVAAPVSAVIRSQVATINIHRRSLYSNLAARKGASPQDVGIT